MAEGPAFPAFERTGQYRATDQNITLVVHAFGVYPPQMHFIYSLTGLPQQVAGTDLALSDDLGREYQVRQNAILGQSDGVALGVLITEPYKTRGSTLYLRGASITFKGGETLKGDWSFPVLGNNSPEEDVGMEGGRVAPEVVTVGDRTLALAGPPGALSAAHPPGGSIEELLVYYSGTTSRIHGLVDPNGTSRPLTPQELRDIMGSNAGGPLPAEPGFPRWDDSNPGTGDAIYPPPPGFPR
ncbi:MAG: hypothetical protein HYY03_05385 [Chloroflexi bacterium]|nr:hypothetical protein [Chloroflexota bacterium]